jgi:MerR family transcriptional regulator, thiopeptide resistance regulator
MWSGHRVGELAAATGLTVRTLHYYEEIGLLVASGRTPAGHRLYGDEDVERLYRICLLRRLGLPLDQIGKALDDPAWAGSATWWPPWPTATGTWPPICCASWRR